MNERTENIRYAILLGLHTMMMCAGLNYVTYYLLSVQLSDRQIGILIAVSCSIAVILQQAAGRLMDTGRLDGKYLVLALCCVQGLAGILTAVIGPAFLKMILFGVLMCNTLVMLPVLNAFGFLYRTGGINVNYGAARGVGSLCYSGISILLGFLTVRLGSTVVPVTFTILGILVFLTVVSMPSLQGAARRTSEKKASLRLSDFPAFTLMLAGVSLVMVFHNMVMTYFIHVVGRAGGNSSHMGIAVGIAGLVEIPVLFFYTRFKGSRPSKYFLALSGAAFTAKAVFFIFANQIWMIYAIQGLQFLAYGLMAASRVYYVHEVVGTEYETTGQAYMAATETLGIVLGSSVGGFLLQGGGIGLLLKTGAAVCAAGLVCMVISAWSPEK